MGGVKHQSGGPGRTAETGVSCPWRPRNSWEVLSWESLGPGLCCMDRDSQRPSGLGERGEGRDLWEHTGEGARGELWVDRW